MYAKFKRICESCIVFVFLSLFYLPLQAAKPYLSYSTFIHETKEIDYQKLNLMLPLYEDLSSVLLLDLTKQFFPKNQQDDKIQSYKSGGIILRNLDEKNNIFGMNYYLEHQKKFNENFYQNSVGVELLNKNIELRANLYKNIIDKEITIRSLSHETKYNPMNGFDFGLSLNLNNHVAISATHFEYYNKQDNFSGKKLELRTKLISDDSLELNLNAGTTVFSENQARDNVIFVEAGLRIRLGNSRQITHHGHQNYCDYLCAIKEKELNRMIFSPTVRRDEIVFSKKITRIPTIVIPKPDELVKILIDSPFTAFFLAKNNTTIVDKKRFEALKLLNVYDASIDVDNIQKQINELGADVLILFDITKQDNSQSEIPNIFTITDSINLKPGQYLIGDGYRFKVQIEDMQKKCPPSNLSKSGDCIVNHDRTHNTESSILKMMNIDLTNPIIKLGNNNGIIGMNINFQANKLGVQTDKLDRNKHNYFIELRNSTKQDKINIQDNRFVSNTENTTIFELKNSCSSTIVSQSCQNPSQSTFTSFVLNPIKFYNNNFILNKSNTIGINTDWISKFGLRENLFNLNSKNTRAINLDSEQTFVSRFNKFTTNQVSNSNRENNSFKVNNQNTAHFSIENYSSPVSLTGEGGIFGNNITNFEWEGNKRSKFEIFTKKNSNLATKLSSTTDTIIFLSQPTTANLSENLSKKETLTHNSGDASESQAKLADNLIVLSNNDKLSEVVIQAKYRKTTPIQLYFHDVGIPWNLKSGSPIACDESNLCSDACNDNNLFDFSPKKQSMIELNSNNIIAGVDFIYSKVKNKTQSCDINLSSLQSSVVIHPNGDNAFIFDIKSSNSYLQNTNVFADIGNSNINFMHFKTMISPQFMNNDFKIKVPLESTANTDFTTVFKFDANISENLKKLQIQNNQTEVALP